MNDPIRFAPPSVAARGIVAGRVGFAVGPRGLALLVAGGLWIVPAFWNPRFVLMMLLWDLMVVAVWGWDMLRLPGPHAIEVRRHWNTTAALTNPGSITLEVCNSGPIPLRLTLVDDVPGGLRPLPPTITIDATPEIDARASYGILPIERGDHRIGPVFCRYRSHLGLGEKWSIAEIPQTVRVYPDIDAAKRHSLHLVRSRQVAVERRHRRRRGIGREFESLREYRQGDQMRDICWTATARRGRLITKVYQVERSQAVWILIDTGRLLRERVGQLSKLDHSVNAALGLAHLALRNGDRVGMIAYGRDTALEIGAGRGAAHLRSIMERLAVLDATAYEADHFRAAETLMSAQKQRSLVVWLTDLAETVTTPDVIRGASSLMPRHAVLLAIIAQPDLHRVADERPPDVERMYRHAAALEMVHRREAAIGSLAQRGAAAFEVPPDGLSVALVNRYLEIKERGLI